MDLIFPRVVIAFLLQTSITEKLSLASCLVFFMNVQSTEVCGEKPLSVCALANPYKTVSNSLKIVP